MKKLFLLPFVLFSFNTYAAPDFSGHWVSTEGKVTSNLSGWGGPCGKIEIVIHQSAGMMLTDRYIAKCSNYSTDWGPVHQEVHDDGTVWERGHQVGTFDGTNLMTEDADGARYTYNLRMTTSASGEPILQSRYGVDNVMWHIMTDAPMHRVNP